MARTPRSAGMQNTLGPVGRAVAPDDIVPLKQATGANTIWGHAHGRAPEVTVSRKLGFYWDAGVYDGEPPLAMPFEMRLKGVGWFPYGKNWDLNIIRNTTVVGTVGANSYSEFDLLFQPVLNGWFQTSSFVRLAFNWNLMTYWEIVSKSGVDARVAESTHQASPDPIAEVLAPIPQIEDQSPAAEPIAAKGSNRFSSWIKRRFR